MFSSTKDFPHLGHIYDEIEEAFTPGTPANGYVAENGTTFYVAEDGSTFYVQET